MQPSVASISILPPPQSTPNNIIPFPQRGITTRFASVGGAMVGLGIFAMELPEILNQAIYDYNGLPRPEQYPYGQDAIDRAMQNAVGTAPLEEIRENARMMEELLLADKVVLNNSQSSDGKTCCKFIWSKFQLGGWPEHDDYAARIFGNRTELIVIAPDKDTARYDGGFTYPQPVNSVGEMNRKKMVCESTF